MKRQNSSPGRRRWNWRQTQEAGRCPSPLRFGMVILGSTCQKGGFGQVLRRNAPLVQRRIVWMPRKLYGVSHAQSSEGRNRTEWIELDYGPWCSLLHLEYFKEFTSLKFQNKIGRKLRSAERPRSILPHMPLLGLRLDTVLRLAVILTNNSLISKLRMIFSQSFCDRTGIFYESGIELREVMKFMEMLAKITMTNIARNVSLDFVDRFVT